MKYVQVLPDIPVTYTEGKTERTELWSFYRYLSELVLTDLAMGTGYPYLKARSILKEQFKQAKVGDWVKLEDDPWKLIANAINEPKGSPATFQRPLDMLQQFIPFMEAVLLHSKDEKPETVD